MKLAKPAAAAIIAAFFVQPAAVAGPEDDRAAFAAYFQARFPDVPFDEFANGIYAIDADSRSQWEMIEEFPPYEFSIERGESLWGQALPNGETYADCFGVPLEDVRPHFPRYDAERGEIVTLELAINDCRTANGAEPWVYGTADIVDVTAYVAYAARGKTVAVDVPADQPGALAAYEAGKRFYYSKRGQLNFTCYDTSLSETCVRDILGGKEYGPVCIRRKPKTIIDVGAYVGVADVEPRHPQVDGGGRSRSQRPRDRRGELDLADAVEPDGVRGGGEEVLGVTSGPGVGVVAGEEAGGVREVVAVPGQHGWGL